MVFTLIELLVTMALLAIMLALAAPSFVTFQRNSELTATANSFVAALSAARAEAMKRQLRTFVIPASGATNWASGWTVFVDVDGNVTSGAMLASSADVVVSRQPALPDSVSVNTSTIATPFVDSGVAYAMFNGSGFMTTLAGGFVTNGLRVDQRNRIPPHHREHHRSPEGVQAGRRGLQYRGRLLVGLAWRPWPSRQAHCVQ